MEQIKILIAEKQPLIAAGLKYFIAAHNEFLIIGEVFNRSELFRSLKASPADLLIISSDNLPEFHTDDFNLIREIVPTTQILAITSAQKREKVMQMTGAGVVGILTKECSQNEILNAIRATAQGEKFFCGKILDLIMEKEIQKRTDSEAASPPLNSRELEIIRFILDGQSTKEIAGRLNLSLHTINAYRKSLLKKMEVHSPAEMAIKAVKMGIVEI